jgi:hypothetical protein
MRLQLFARLSCYKWPKNKEKKNFIYLHGQGNSCICSIFPLSSITAEIKSIEVSANVFISVFMWFHRSLENHKLSDLREIRNNLPQILMRSVEKTNSYNTSCWSYIVWNSQWPFAQRIRTYSASWLLAFSYYNLFTKRSPWYQKLLQICGKKKKLILVGNESS